MPAVGVAALGAGAPDGIEVGEFVLQRASEHLVGTQRVTAPQQYLGHALAWGHHLMAEVGISRGELDDEA